MDEHGLIKLKGKIDKAKQEVSELSGQQKALQSQLKEEFECATIEQAAKKLEKMEQDQTKLQEQIDTALEEIEEQYEAAG